MINLANLAISGLTIFLAILLQGCMAAALPMICLLYTSRCVYETVATPYSGYSFSSWSESSVCSGQGSTCTFNMPASAVTLTANFTVTSVNAWIDTYVRSSRSSAADGNYGLDSYDLSVGGWGDLYYSYIQFDVTSQPSSVASVKLRLYVTSEEIGGWTYPNMTLWTTGGTWVEGMQWQAQPCLLYTSRCV